MLTYSEYKKTLRCSVEGCDRNYKAKGLCGTHYSRLRTKGSVEEEIPVKLKAKGKICSVENCSNECIAKELCSAHYARLSKGIEIDSPIKKVAPKGSGHINKNGYFHIKGKLEHRKVMEDYLGRPLRKDEIVHHKNGDRLDNRIDNLEIWSTSHPKGQKIQDKLMWAAEFINLYKDQILDHPDLNNREDLLVMAESMINGRS